jgi:hypothetical protein
VSGYHIFNDHRYSTHCRRVSGVQRGVKGMDLDAKVASVDIVTEKHISCVSGAPTDFEQFHVVILPLVNSQRRTHRTRPRTYCPWISPQTGMIISIWVEAKKGVTDL